MSKKGFTIIEVLVVIGIIAVLVAAAVPMYNRARQRSTDTKVISAWREACERYASYRASGGTSATQAEVASWLGNEGFPAADIVSPKACTASGCIATAQKIQSGDIAVGDTTVKKGEHGKCTWDPSSQKMNYSSGDL